MATGADLTIVVPLWKRTKNLPRLFESIERTVPEAEVLLVVSCDDDEAKFGILDSSVLLHRAKILTVDWPGGVQGDWAKKINAGIAATQRDFVFTGADDLVFHDDWYAPARALMADPRESTQVLSGGATLTGPFGLMHEGAVGVVGTVDLCNERTMRGEHSTHFLAARWYVERLGTIDASGRLLDEGYPHDYVDDEAIQTAMARGAYAHSFESVVEHMHPNIDKAEDDETYRHGRALSRLGRRRYLYRKRFWGG